MGRSLATFAVVISLTFGVLGQAPARASQEDPRLTELFQRLRNSDDKREADELTQEIWSIWRHAGVPAVDWMMRESQRFIAEGKLELALGGLGLIVESAPDFAEGWHKRATVHFLMGNFAASVRDIQKTVTLEPRHFGAFAGLGLIYLKMGEEQAALKALERALAINPHLRGTRLKTEELRRKIRGKKI